MLTFSVALAIAWFIFNTVMDRHFGIRGWKFNLFGSALIPATVWLWLRYCQG